MRGCADAVQGLLAVKGVGGQSAPIQKTAPIRIAGTTIPGRSIVSHQGDSVMAVTPHPYLGEKQREEYELVHTQRALETH
jgi:hypothetical protein